MNFYLNKGDSLWQAQIQLELADKQCGPNIRRSDEICAWEEGLIQQPREILLDLDGEPSSRAKVSPCNLELVLIGNG